MNELLDRHELPIQSINERNQDCTATVPVHLKVIGLPKSTRTDFSLIRTARKTVREWYNEDMNYYLKILELGGYDLPWLKGYEKFKDDWTLTGSTGDDFINLILKENGKSHTIKYSSIPTPLYNQWNELNEFYTPEHFRETDAHEILYRGVRDSDVVYMSPEKMLKYGITASITTFAPERGIAEVMGTTFSSDYNANAAIPLLLRNFAVCYHNNLLLRI